MSGDTLNLQVTIVTPNGEVVVPVTPRASLPVAEFMARLIREYGLVGEPVNWQLIYARQPLVLDRPLGEQLPPGPALVSLSLTPTGATLPRGLPGLSGSVANPPGRAAPPARSGAVAAPPARSGTVPAPGTRPAPAAPPMASAPAPAPSAEAASVSPTADTAPLRMPKRPIEVEQRRATVRYYSRMNPDRVFPLLVTLTREEVERVVKRNVEQTATGPLALATDVPLEVEPVLPGCQCHPPKIVTRLGDGNDVFTFHVVPHVIGDVTGARVVIRQDHATVAELELRVRVVQRTIVVASGLSTFAVPFASAAMRHFGLDFTPKDGSNPYLAALNFLFGQVSPVVLTLALAAVTLGLYWWTRPKGRDVFWDITTKPAK
ncbi:unnamed protein product [Gemmataceae bacterium]|nr:unnamed protein product [Gemmataceae bacterium]VTT98086.1 unnamed protein product [Gemmataceae bacterium]